MFKNIINLIKTLVPYAAIYFFFTKAREIIDYILEAPGRGYKAIKEEGVKAAEKIAEKTKETANWGWAKAAGLVSSTMGGIAATGLFVFKKTKEVTRFVKDTFGDGGFFGKGGGASLYIKDAIDNTVELAKQSIDATVQATKQGLLEAVTGTPVGDIVTDLAKVTGSASGFVEKIAPTLNLVAETAKAATVATVALAPLTEGVKNAWINAANRSRIEDIDPLDSLEEILSSTTPNALWEGIKSYAHAAATILAKQTNKIIEGTVESPTANIAAETANIAAETANIAAETANIAAETANIAAEISNIPTTVIDSDIAQYVGLGLFAAAAIVLVVYGRTTRPDRGDPTGVDAIEITPVDLDLRTIYPEEKNIFGVNPLLMLYRVITRNITRNNTVVSPQENTIETSVEIPQLRDTTIQELIENAEKASSEVDRVMIHA